jgi:hypothetical protein
MTISALDRVKAKLERAQEHLDTFETYRHEFMATRPCVLRREAYQDDEAGQWEDRWVVHSVHEADIRLSLIAGDCLHNARSCLDHLVYALWEAHGGPIPPSLERRPSFPIYLNKKEYEERAPSQIEGVHPGAQDTIEGLQPYHETRKVMPPWPETEGPWYAAERHPLTVLTAVGHFLFNPPAGGVWLANSTGVIEAGSELARWAYPAQPQTGDQVDPQFIFDIAFAEGPPSVWPARFYLRRVLHYIRIEVLRPLRAFL